MERKWKQKWTKTDWCSFLTDAPAVLVCRGRERELNRKAQPSIYQLIYDLHLEFDTDQKTVARKPTMHSHHLPKSSSILMFVYTKILERN